MQEANYNKSSDDYEDLINLRELFDILMHGKWIIISATTFVTIAGVVYSLFLPNIYESKALVVPVGSSSGISRALQGYSGLAGLAGISLPSANAGESNSVKAMEKITSLSFFENNIIKNIFLPDLMALKSWNPNSNTLIYDQDIYNQDKNTWVRDYSYPQKQIPSAQESFKVFLTDHLALSEDKNTGFITISIKHKSPYVAKQWTELIINEVNSFYRQQDKSKSEKTVRYLNKQISMNSLSEVKRVISELMQDETQKLALIEANEFYVFDYIDQPVVEEEKSEPNRLTIIFLSLFLGIILSIVLVFLNHYFLKKEVA